MTPSQTKAFAPPFEMSETPEQPYPSISKPLRRGSYPIQAGPEALRSPTSLFANPFDESRSSGRQPLEGIPDSIRAVNSSARCKEGHNYGPTSNNPTPRTIVICLDGTGDQFDADNSNVVRFVSCLKKDNPNQITYYQSGIGTYKSGHHLQDGISAAVDMAVGSGLGLHVRGAYNFLMQNYNENDRICMFGFSRGAYTVRCLAGMLHKVGLLPAHNTDQISFAYRFFKDDTPEGWKMSAEFKKTFCTDVDVHFVGVWDCVASVGFIPRTLPFSKGSNNSIRHFRHALALDEHRAKFKACHWIQREHSQARLQLHADTMAGIVREPEEIEGLDAEPGTTRRPSVVKSLLNGGIRGSRRNSSQVESARSLSQSGSSMHREGTAVNGSVENEDIHHLDRREKKQAILETAFEQTPELEEEDKFETDVEEVWFVGAHADVGGGAVPNETRHQLARIPLRWMIRECFECDTNIIFRTDALAEMGLDVETLYPVYRRREVPVISEPPPRILEQYRTHSLPSLLQRANSFKAKSLPSRSKRARSPFFPAPSPSSPSTLKLVAEEEVPAEYLKEANEDYFDALAPINDQLAVSKGWWVLEAWPVKVRTQNKDDNEWTKHIAMNRGRYRAIRTEEPKMHWTVRLRMDAAKYKPKVRVAREAAWKIVV